MVEAELGVVPTNQLRKNSLGVAAITFLVVSAAAPLTALAGAVPLGILMGDGVGIPGAFAIVTLILLLFSAGYVAMSRHVSNAGGFYSYSARGLGGIAGGAAALIAIVSYNAMQIGVFGLFGSATAGFLATLGLNLPWWVCTLAGIAIVGFLGYRQVNLSARILMVLVTCEYLILLVVDLAIVGKGGDSGLSLAPFSLSNIMTGSPAIGVLFCFASFIGFEATTIYREEAKNPDVTVPRATYISVLAIGLFYVFTAWCMIVGAGADKVMPVLQGLKDPTTFMFGLSDRYVGNVATQTMSLLFISSLFACVQAFHNCVARYLYVGGREKLLPSGLGVTHKVFSSPHVGSLVQSVTAVVVVMLFVVLGLDPVLALFSWLTTVATLGVMVLMAMASLSVVIFFSKNPALAPNAMSSKLMPLVSLVLLSVVIVLVFVNFGNLSGASGFLGWFLPSLVPLAAVAGALLAGGLKQRSPSDFAQLGNAKLQ